MVEYIFLYYFISGIENEFLVLINNLVENIVVLRLGFGIIRRCKFDFNFLLVV